MEYEGDWNHTLSNIFNGMVEDHDMRFHTLFRNLWNSLGLHVQGHAINIDNFGQLWEEVRHQEV